MVCNAFMHVILLTKNIVLVYAIYIFFFLKRKNNKVPYVVVVNKF